MMNSGLQTTKRLQEWELQTTDMMYGFKRFGISTAYDKNVHAVQFRHYLLVSTRTIAGRTPQLAEFNISYLHFNNFSVKTLLVNTHAKPASKKVCEFLVSIQIKVA